MPVSNLEPLVVTGRCQKHSIVYMSDAKSKGGSGCLPFFSNLKLVPNRDVIIDVELKSFAPPKLLRLLHAKGSTAVEGPIGTHESLVGFSFLRKSHLYIQNI